MGEDCYMSHIHEALKKAQKNRDVHDLKYSGILAASRGKRRSLGRKTIRWVFPLVIVILLAFFYNLWLDFTRLQTPAPPEKKHQGFKTALEGNSSDRIQKKSPENLQAIKLGDSKPVSSGTPKGVELGEFRTSKMRSPKADDLGPPQAIKMERSQADDLGPPPQAIKMERSQAEGSIQAVKLRDPQPIVPDNPEETYERARRFQKEGRLEEAERLYEEILRLDPGHVDTLNNLGVIFIRKRDYLSAQRHLEKAVRLKPRYAEPYYNLACLKAITGDTKQALAYLQKAVSLDPTVRDWAQRDADLEALRQLPEFKELI